MLREGANLFIDGEVMKSAEGTTQGDPTAMYVIGIAPLIQRMGHINSSKQVWYANNSTASGSLQDLLPLGYHPNAFKSILLVKPEQY